MEYKLFIITVVITIIVSLIAGEVIMTKREERAIVEHENKKLFYKQCSDDGYNKTQCDFILKKNNNGADMDFITGVVVGRQL